MNITLTPIELRPEFAIALEKEINAFMAETLFEPLAAVIDVPVRLNEDEAIVAALLAGTLWYLDDRFSGAFNASISRQLRALGAVKLAGSFLLPTSQMPVGLQTAIAQVRQNNYQQHSLVTAFLIAMGANVSLALTGIKFTNTVDKLYADLQKQFSRSVSGIPQLKDSPPLPEGFKSTLQEEMTRSTNDAIKRFAAESILQLREKVQQNLAAGGRVDQLARIIESEFGVAKRKAAIIADAEASLFTAAYRQARYESVGSVSYSWETMGDSRVRPTHGESNNHRVLNRRVFRWDSPPVVDVATGRRRHPGQDYGPCRCLARPIIPLT